MSAEQDPKGPLCVTTFVFGAAHQEFIPLFIYSVLRAYPEYYPLIFVQGELSHGLRQRLDLLRGLGEFAVRERCFDGLGWNGQRARSLRWLLYDSKFADFEAVYAGDIDMLMMPEFPKLHEQHNIHCKLIGLPYSNVLRPPQLRVVRKGPLCLAKRALRTGLKRMICSLMYSTVEVRQLTGLHYMQTDAYFRAVLPKMIEFAAILGSRSANRLWDRPQYIDGLVNEAVLYDLIEESGLGFPPVADDMAEPIDLEYRRYDFPDFRPHHGIHLGIFRTPLTPAKMSILQLGCYREYYRQYKKMKSDPLFQEIVRQSSDMTCNIISKMEVVCETIESQ